MQVAESFNMTFELPFTMPPAHCQRFKNKVAVVTAATAGIGLAIAYRLAQEGASVVISSRKQKNVDEVVQFLSLKGFDVIGVQCHVDKDEDRANLVKTVKELKGRVDVLVSNAASSTHMGSILDVKDSDWDKMFRTNVRAGLLLSQAFVPLMPSGSSILFVSSIAGFTPEFPISTYGVTKTALFGLTKALAKELSREKNIRVNCLAPGVIKTSFSKTLWESESAHEMSTSSVFMQRIGVPHEMAGPAAFLCSEDASFITGEIIIAAGGVNARI